MTRDGIEKTPSKVFSFLFTTVTIKVFRFLQRVPPARYAATGLLALIVGSTLVRLSPIMMPRNTLRRLSVALKLTDAYFPPTEPMPSSSPGLSQFLATSKTDFLKDITDSPAKGAEWTVVMGNEAGGMTSFGSSNSRL